MRSGKWPKTAEDHWEKLRCRAVYAWFRKTPLGKTTEILVALWPFYHFSRGWPLFWALGVQGRSENANLAATLPLPHSASTALLEAPEVLWGPRRPDLVPTAPHWPVWVGLMVTTHMEIHTPMECGSPWRMLWTWQRRLRGWRRRMPIQILYILFFIFLIYCRERSPQRYALKKNYGIIWGGSSQFPKLL